MGFLSDAAGAVGGAFSGGGIGGALAGGFLGGGMGATIGGLGSDNIMGLFNPDPMLNPQFNPFGVTGPFGSMSFDPESRQINLALSPEQQMIQSQLMGAMGGGPFGMTPAQSLFSQQGATLGQDALGLGAMSGLFGRSLGQQAAGAGSNFLNAAGAADPTQIASQQFDRMQALLSPRRERERLGLESRLLRQGLLSSTAGGEQFRAMNEANAMQDANLAERALREGFNTQSGLFGMGLQGLQAGQGLFGAGTGQQMNAMQTGLGFLGTPVQQQNRALQNYFGLLGAQQGLGQNLLNQANLGIGAGQTQAGINQANVAAQNAQAQNQADMFSGLLSGGLGLLAGM